MFDVIILLEVQDTVYAVDLYLQGCLGFYLCAFMVFYFKIFMNLTLKMYICTIKTLLAFSVLRLPRSLHSLKSADHHLKFLVHFFLHFFMQIQANMNVFLILPPTTRGTLYTLFSVCCFF